MLAVTIIATVIAALSTMVAVMALRHAKSSAHAARRSAEAAERSAGAAAVTAAADRAEDHRRRAPRLLLEPDVLAEHDGDRVIYRITNNGPVDLDSVIVHRPIVGIVEGSIVHPVSATGRPDVDWADEVEIGRIELGTYGRFTLSLGSTQNLPEFRVKIVSTVGAEQWTQVELLRETRKAPPARVASARVAGRRTRSSGGS